MTRKTDGLLFKTLAFVLCVVVLVLTLAGGAATLVLAAGGGSDEQTLQETYLKDRMYSDMHSILRTYAQEKFGNLTKEDYCGKADYALWYSEDSGALELSGIYTGSSNLRYEIFDASGKRVAGNYEGEETLCTAALYQTAWYLTREEGYFGTFEDEVAFDPLDRQEAEPATEDLPEGLPEETMWTETTVPTDPTMLEYGLVTHWAETPEEYQIVGHLLADLPYEGDTYYSIGQLLHMIYANRRLALAACIGGLVWTILMLVYLCSAAGRRPDEPGIHLNFLDKLPLDIYAAAVTLAVFGLAYLMFQTVESLCYPLLYGTGSSYRSPVAVSYLLWLEAALAALGFTLVLGLILTLAARFKYGRGYWWRHSVIGWCLRMVWHGLRWCFRGLRAVYRMLPVIWRWLAVAFLLWLAVFWSVLVFYDTTGGAFLIISVLIWLIVFYAAWAMGRLKVNTRRMAEGDYAAVDTRHLHGVFREISESLGDLGRGAERAVAEKMKSERLKTELITNVSHDIKTPLTSIVNYVDLLQKPHTPEQEREYLAVLDRQSKRMKKLTEDLVEMSKASTGNIQAELMPTNLVELANQALAEYEEKFQRGKLYPEMTVIDKKGRRLNGDARITVMADGRLLWRVLDNLLGNVVKYALPGTRVYLDIVEYERKIMLSVKNVSRDRLNVSAEELMERFVRGDASRNTEGSGLGLNIAKTLTELQKAKLNLVVDGDLFKAVLLYDTPDLRDLPPEDVPEAE